MKSIAVILSIGTLCLSAFAQPVSPTGSAGDFAPLTWSDARPLAAYHHNKPDQVYAWLAKEVLAVGALDQFSTTVERAAHASALMALEKKIGDIPLIVDCEKTYVPDRQSFEFATRTLTNGSGGGSLETSVLTGVDSTPVVDEYRGQNAYGATTMITRHVFDRFVVFVTRVSLLAVSAVDVSPALTSMKMTVPIAPAEARTGQHNMACLVTVQPTSPYVSLGKAGHRPTLEDPIETNITVKGLVGKVTRMVVFNKTTGQLYRSGSAMDDDVELIANSPLALDEEGRRKPQPAIRLTAGVQEAYESGFFSNDWSGLTILNPGRLQRAGEDKNGTFYRDPSGRFKFKMGLIECECGLYVPNDASRPALVYRRVATIGAAGIVFGQRPVDTFKVVLHSL
jgi:hypothetical protein